MKSDDHGSCLNLLNDLECRGLPAEGLLFIVDGGTGLNKALDLLWALRNAKDMCKVKNISDKFESVLRNLNIWERFTVTKKRKTTC